MDACSLGEQQRIEILKAAWSGELSNAVKFAHVPGTTVIEVNGLSVARQRGGKSMLDDIHFTVREGEVVGIAGISATGIVASIS